MNILVVSERMRYDENHVNDRKHEVLLLRHVIVKNKLDNTLYRINIMRYCNKTVNIYIYIFIDSVFYSNTIFIHSFEVYKIIGVH